MSINQYFAPWQKSAIPRVYTSAPNASTGMAENGSPVNSDAVKGVMYTASAAERYFSQTWATDVTKVFAAEEVGGMVEDGKLVYAGVEYTIDSIDNVGEQDEVWTVGLKVIR
jgi:hypothetical protein